MANQEYNTRTLGDMVKGLVALAIASYIAVIIWNICWFFFLRFFGFRAYGFTIDTAIFGWMFAALIVAPACVLIVGTNNGANVAGWVIGAIFGPILGLAFLRWEASTVPR
jgi:hypothetical protein